MADMMAVVHESSILYPDNGVSPSVCHGCGNKVQCTVPCEVSRHNVGLSANSEWWVGSRP